MPHFVEEPFADTPKQLEALFRLLHGPRFGREPGATGRPEERPEPPTLESRFGHRAVPREAGGQRPRPGSGPGPAPRLCACRTAGSG